MNYETIFPLIRNMYTVLFSHCGRFIVVEGHVCHNHINPYEIQCRDLCLMHMVSQATFEHFAHAAKEEEWKVFESAVFCFLSLYLCSFTLVPQHMLKGMRAG